MHARTDGYWFQSHPNYPIKNNHLIKIGEECFVESLPTTVYPVDIAVGIEEIKQGNNVTREEDEKEEYWIVDELRSFTDSERNALHVEIKDMCLNSEIKYFKKMSITKEQSDNLRMGNVVIMYPNLAQSNCQLKSAAIAKSTGSWREPNPGSGQEVFIHHIMSSISWITCCDEQTGTDLNYCRCSDITDSESFEFCVGPRPDALLLVAGDETEGPSNSVEILVRNVHGEYEPRSPKGCYKFPNSTSSATGAVYNDIPTVCPGYIEGA